MESLGGKLKTSREQKGFTFDQIARDTNITRRYLEALENEDFTQFPGEPYLLGFLRNYGEYLGLDVHELISSYRMMKIQEQPIPVEQLLKRSGPSPMLIGGAIGGGAFLVILVIVLVSIASASKTSSAEADARKPQQYSLVSGSLEKRLYTGDSLLVAVGTDTFKVAVSALGERLTLSLPSGDSQFELGQEGAVDLNGDGISDLRVFVADLFKNEPKKGVSLRFEVLGAETVVPAGTTQNPSASAAPVAETAAPAPISTDSTTPTAGPVLLSSPNPYPFTLQATFKGYCMFRWESDRKEREERYFHKAEILNVQSQNGIRVWVSNASAVKLVAIGGGKTVDIEIGGSGEVVVTDIKWVKDEDGRFKLTTIRLE
jgi:cytoskeletal protein RodZ